MNREEMLERLKTKLNDKRLKHSLGVEYTAACMAMRYGYDVEKARIAGLLHDCAKCIPSDTKLKKAEKHGLPINDTEKKNPDLLHGKLGAYYANKKYGVEDPEILGAITWHTTGKPGMNLLEKIIFIADYIEPNRKPIPEIDIIRQEAFTDLDRAVVHILKNTLIFLDAKQETIDRITRETYEYYVTLMED